MSNNLLDQATKAYEDCDLLDPADASFIRALDLLSQLAANELFSDEARALRWHLFYLQKEYASAIADLDVIISNSPDSRNSFYNRGTVRFRLKEYAQAAADFRAAENLATAANDDALVDAIEHYLEEIEELGA